MALGEPVKVRLSLEKQLHYEEEASRQGKPLSVYIRERLEAGDRLRDELSALRNNVEDSIGALRQDLATLWHSLRDKEGANPVGGVGAGDREFLIELLLMVRSIASPDRLTMVHAELRRLGFEPWTTNAGKP